MQNCQFKAESRLYKTYKCAALGEVERLLKSALRLAKGSLFAHIRDVHVQGDKTGFRVEMLFNQIEENDTLHTDLREFKHTGAEVDLGNYQYH